MNTEGVMELGNPTALYLLLIILVVWLLFALYSHKRDKSTAGDLKVNYSSRQYIALGVLWSLVLAGLIGALADPRIATYGPPEDLPRGEYVFLVNTSLSMDAQPYPYNPNENSRMETARKIMAYVSGNMHARFLVFGYSGMAEPLSGFIDDQSEFNNLIKYGVYTDLFPESGNDLPHALARVAREKQENPRYENVTHVVLFSGGKLESESGSKIDESLQSVRDAGLAVVAVGMGSGGSEKIPFFDEQGNFSGQYYAVTDSRTEYVAGLHEDNLRRVADATGGRYFHESQIEELVEYLTETLQEDPLSVEHDRETMSVQSFDWMFVVMSFAAFAVILAFSRKFYY
ncbi:MAG: vWA domain-containing protein [Candidatus Spechtbacterales bacterium]